MRPTKSRANPAPWRNRVLWSTITLTLLVFAIGIGISWPVIVEWWELREVQTSVAGLTCEIRKVTRIVDQGDDVEVEIVFRFQDGQHTFKGQFETNDSNREYSFTFRSRETGRRFERKPRFEYSYPSFSDSDDWVELTPGIVAAETVYVPLVSADGEGMPPGIYQVFAEYENFDALESATPISDPPEATWRGKLVSSPAKLIVRPKTPWIESIRVPREPDAELSGQQLRWRWRAEDVEEVEIERRRGYALSYSLHYSLEVDERVERPGGSSGSGKIIDRSSRPSSLQHPIPRGPLKAAFGARAARVPRHLRTRAPSKCTVVYIESTSHPALAN